MSLKVPGRLWDKIKALEKMLSHSISLKSIRLPVAAVAAATIIVSYDYSLTTDWRNDSTSYLSMPSPIQ